ncbi:MAG: Sec-independent protein translocase protein TatB [Pseudomonadaceae bacterium]|jgi:sec-independent protein translocase protein TatB|nr:Sec-independent protein translocase protein TatB [Pseudomonadaceae bacterium]
MFGISFGELLLIGLIALLVLGPERLPGAARTAGLWVGRLKRSFNAIKQDVEREIGADEIRRQLHNENVMALQSKSKAASSSILDESTQMTALATPVAPTAPAAPIIEPPQTPRGL